VNEHAKSGRILKPIRIGTSVRWNVIELRRWTDAGCPSNEEWQKLKEMMDKKEKCLWMGQGIQRRRIVELPPLPLILLWHFFLSNAPSW
jgi:hypothetical protein